MKERSGALASSDGKAEVPVGVPMARAAHPSTSDVNGTEIVVDGGHTGGFLLAALMSR
ncbi:MAG: hypothetical protein ABIQ73_02355 [Acidimicrobiales bacterium]